MKHFAEVSQPVMLFKSPETTDPKSGGDLEESYRTPPQDWGQVFFGLNQPFLQIMKVADKLRRDKA